MKQITREWLAFLREQYPVGSRIRLNSMEDPYAPVEPGTMGTLQRIDDAGQFLMKWDNGRTLSLIPGEDSFSLILPEPTMMKLYMPLHADLYTKDDWSDTSEEPEMLTGRALMEYEDSILIALIKTVCRRKPSEASCAGMVERTVSTARLNPSYLPQRSEKANSGALPSAKWSVNLHPKNWIP